jgi:hypothetical protein
LFLNKNSVNNNEVKRFGRFSSVFLKAVNIMHGFLRHNADHVKPGVNDFSTHQKQVMNIFYQFVFIDFIQHETDKLF